MNERRSQPTASALAPQSPAPVAGAVEALESILAICNETCEARDLQPRMTEIRSIARAALAARSAPAVAEKVPLSPQVLDAMEAARRVMVMVTDEEWVPFNSSIAGALGVAIDAIDAAVVGSGSAQEGQAK